MAPAAIVFPTYVEGSSCSLIPLAPTAAVVEAANNTLNFFELGGRAFRAVSRMVREARAYRLVFGDLSEACALVRVAAAEGAQ